MVFCLCNADVSARRHQRVTSTPSDNSSDASTTRNMHDQINKAYRLTDLDTRT